MDRTERMESELARGFEALEAGDFDAAAAVVARCKRIDRHHPELIGLAAAVADAQGDTEEALAQYHALSELHPDDAPPRIAIARLELHDVGDPDAAIATLDAATDFIDEESDLIDAVMLRAEAEILREDLEAAREALAELASSAIDDPPLELELAELSMFAEDLARARTWAKAAIDHASTAIERTPAERDELRGDGYHLLGQICDADGDRAGMIAAWQEVGKLDATLEPPEFTISEDELEKIAVGTLEELPETVREKLARVPILIADAPTADQIADGIDPRLLGLFQGTPMPDGGDTAPVVTNIHLFRKNLERASEDAEHLAEEIRTTVLHETAHYFGLDEDELEELGLD